MKKTISHFAVPIALAAVMISCIFDSGSGGNSAPQGLTGVLDLNIKLNGNNRALLKTASADTIFNLDTLKIVLTAPNTTPQTFSYPVSGRPDTGAITVSPKIYSLAAERVWTAKILTIDTTLNPTRTDTVHLDSVTFTTHAGDTTVVNKSVNAVFSILRVRLASFIPDSISDTIQYLRIRVDGTTRDSIVIGNTLKAVDFLSGFTAVGFAVGERGRIMKTRNSGTTWSIQTSGMTQTLNSVSFVPTDSSKGWVAGNNGTILKTTNGGTTWSSQTSGTSENLTRIQFPVDANTGFAVGDAGNILKTQDGGTTWSILHDGWFAQSSGTTQDMNATYFADTLTGYSVGNNGTILKTTNGGASWAAQTSNTTNALKSVYFANASIGIAVGASGTIRYTSNGGTTWSTATVTGGTLNGLNSVAFVSGGSTTIAYVVGDNGLAAKTTNGGANWTFLSAATVGAGSGSLNSIAFQDNSLGMIVGNTGVVRKISTASGTQTYATGGTITGNPNLRSTAYDFATGDFVVAGDAGIIYKTANFNNGSPTWNSQTSGTTQNITNVHFFDVNNGFAVGSSGIVLKTTNAGTNWTASDTAAQALNGVYASSAYIGYAVGAAGTIVKTTSGGKRWNIVPLNGAYFMSGTSGWVAGASGTIDSTADGGRSWIAQTSNTTQDLLGIHFFSATAGEAVGNAGTACKTTNGTSWSCTTAGTKPLRSVVVTSSGNGGIVYAVGDSLWKCSNFAQTQTWALQTSASTQLLNGVDFTSTTAGYAVGGLENIISTTNGTAWSLKTSGTKQFDTLLTYKYLRPNVSHTILLDAMIRFALPLKGYQKSITLNLAPGKDTTITPNSNLTKCGYGGPTCQ